LHSLIIPRLMQEFDLKRQNDTKVVFLCQIKPKKIRVDIFSPGSDYLKVN
jgi:hypothetical protein